MVDADRVLMLTRLPPVLMHLMCQEPLALHLSLHHSMPPTYDKHAWDEEKNYVLSLSNLMPSRSYRL
jgi:hypothetical protein